MNQTRTFLLAVILSVVGCTKNAGPGTPSPGTGSDSLLSKEVLVYKDASISVDSVVTSFQYNANNTLSSSEQTSTSSLGDTVITESLSYNFTYSGSLVSSFTGVYKESIVGGALAVNASINVSTTFQSSGGQVTGYVQVVTGSSGSPFIPVTQETGNDSATMSYNSSGQLTNYTVYQREGGTGSYLPLEIENLRYSGKNLSNTVAVIYVVGIPEDTVTTTYQYNSKASSAPFYFIVPGVVINTINDIAEVTETTTGINPSAQTTTLHTTYNSGNQPINATGSVDITTASSNNPASETIAYYYQ